VLPGSIGTFAELIMAWNAAYVAPFRGDVPKPVVAVGSVWEDILETLHRRLPTGQGFVRIAHTVPLALAAVESMIPAISDGGR
jgi:predicted Rossmann-fold nucleotide-binding protein